jgi:hypothetical protein
MSIAKFFKNLCRPLGKLLQGRTPTEQAVSVERTMRPEYPYIRIYMDATGSTYEEAENAFKRASKTTQAKEKRAACRTTKINWCFPL